MGFGFNFLFKKGQNEVPDKKGQNEVPELLNEENVDFEGDFECINFVCLNGGDPDYIYCKDWVLITDNYDEMLEKLILRNGVDEKRAKEYVEATISFLKIYMDKKGDIDFVFEFHLSYDDEIIDENEAEKNFEFGYRFSEEHGRMVCYRCETKEIVFVPTEKEREILIRKAKENFYDCFGVDLMRLPELIKGCCSVEQLYDKLEIERGKGVEKIVEVYCMEKMLVQLFNEKAFNSLSKTVLACTFSPDLSTSMELRKETGLQGQGNVECVAIFDNHMEMTLEVNGDNEKKTITPKSSLEKEIRAGISAMYEKKLGYSLAEYISRNCPQVYDEKVKIEDMEYYCKEMRKQNFFNQEMTPDFYNEERLKDWALHLLCDYECYDITPFALHKELDYYKFPDMETRCVLRQELRDYKEWYEQFLEDKNNGLFDNIEDDEEIPF